MLRGKYSYFGGDIVVSYDNLHEKMDFEYTSVEMSIAIILIVILVVEAKLEIKLKSIY